MNFHVDKIRINEEVLHKIGEIADEHRAEAYAVGGYVRDYLFGKKCKDIDIVVVGNGVEFAKLVAQRFGRKKIVIYERFGTAVLPIDSSEIEKIEFVGARKESYHRDSRKPDVEGGSLQDDLSRRDFTINALAVSLNHEHFGEIVDPFDGRTDLKEGIIRTPLEPERTFDDDPLRMMRAVRFAARFGFKVETRTYQAIGEMNDRLAIVSQERITDELFKILASSRASVGLKIMQSTGLMKIVFPEVSEMVGVEQRQDYHHKDVFYHTMKVVDNISEATENLWLRFAALVHDIGKPRTKAFREDVGWTFYGHEEVGARMMKYIFKRMRFPMESLPYVEKLIRLHLRPMALVDEGVTDSAVRRLLYEAGEQIDDLIILCRSDITSKDPKKVERYVQNYELLVQKMREVEERDRIREFQPPVRGDEIMELFGLAPGPLVGKLKNRIKDAILDGIIPNEREPALEFLFKIKDEVMSQNNPTAK
jgi:poly(A) polymerase